MSYSRNERSVIPYLFIIFFAIIFIVDGIIVYLALSTSTGLYTDNAYEKGLMYNKIIAQFNQQEQSPLKPTIKIDSNNVLKVKIGLDNLDQVSNVIADFISPVQAKEDFRVKLTQKNGEYVALIKAPRPGQWQVRVHFESSGKEYQYNKRVLINA
jgi:nitrogen fixation protein FixH